MAGILIGTGGGFPIEANPGYDALLDFSANSFTSRDHRNKTVGTTKLTTPLVEVGSRRTIQIPFFERRMPTPHRP